MAPRKMDRFKKFPAEIRLNIWKTHMEDSGQVLRTEWKLETSANVNVATYHVARSKVPAILHTCHESRKEAKRYYSLVHSHLPINGPGPVTGLDQEIYINFNVDTLYVVRLPNVARFVDWLIRLSREGVAQHGNRRHVVKHLALPAYMDRMLFSRGESNPSRWNPNPRPGVDTSLAYYLCMCHHKIETLALVIDNSQFHKDDKPEEYTFGNPSFPWKQFGGGNRGNHFSVDSLYKVTRDFFEVAFKGKNRDKARWNRFKALHPNWAGPTLPILTISKAKKPS